MMKLAEFLTLNSFVALLVVFSAGCNNSHTPIKISGLQEWHYMQDSLLSTCDADSGRIRTNGKSHFQDLVETQSHRKVLQDFILKNPDGNWGDMVFQDVFSVSEYQWSHYILKEDKKYKLKYKLVGDEISWNEIESPETFEIVERRYLEKRDALSCCDSCVYNSFLETVTQSVSR